jgi:hypothetical protein
MTGHPTLSTGEPWWCMICRSLPENVVGIIVRRLDMPTTGLVLFAKTKPMQSWLCTQFQFRRVERRYVSVLDTSGLRDKSHLEGDSCLWRVAIRLNMLTCCACEQWVALVPFVLALGVMVQIGYCMRRITWTIPRGPTQSIVKRFIVSSKPSPVALSSSCLLSREGGSLIG